VNTRLGRLAEVLTAEGVDAYFASTAISMGYLHGFHESGGERFLTLGLRANGETRMICPALSEAQARRVGIADVRSWRDGEDPIAHFRRLAEDWDLRAAVIAVDDDMSAAMLLAMQEALPAALFKPGQRLLASLMQIKDAGEIELMRRAARIADAAFPAALAALRPGVTEREVARALYAEMQRLGGEPTFAIVATGANGAEPHHHSDDTPIGIGDVVILDFGCHVEGYQSDITRTVAVGDASDRARAIYALVHRAHMAGRAAAVAGATCGDVDTASRAVIEAAGLGERFMHRTGHGIGMKGHEEPFIIGGSRVPLADGHCFSVEPGVYLEGEFGVRIENIVTMSGGVCVSLNEEPRDELQVVGLE
jgi:Xaa-Pro aminopeptidase